MHMRMGSSTKHTKNSSSIMAEIEPLAVVGLSPSKSFRALPAEPVSAVSAMLYAEQLKYSYPTAEAQATAGLYVNRRFASYLSKLCKACLDYFAAVDQATRKEAGLGAEFRKDGMTEHVDAFVDLQSVFSATSEKLKLFAQAVMTDVVQPIQVHHTQATSQLKSITEQHRQLFKPFLALHSHRQKCLDRLAEFTAAKGTAKAAALRPKLEAEFNKFGSMKAAVANLSGPYYAGTEALLLALQQLEEGRLRVLQTGLQELSRRCAAMDASIPFVSEFAKSTQRLSEAKSMQQFVSKPHPSTASREHGHNSAGGPPVPDLPPLPAMDASFSSPARAASLSSISPPPELPPSLPSSLPSLPSSLPSFPPSSSSSSSSSASSSPPSSLPRSLPPSLAEEVIVEAQWDYPGSGDPSYDLVFGQGARIRLLDHLDLDWQEGAEPVWVMGEDLATGKRGGFPTNFVTRVS